MQIYVNKNLILATNFSKDNVTQKKVTQAAKKPVNSSINNRIREQRMEEAEKEWQDIRDINMFGNGIKIYYDLTERIWLDNNAIFTQHTPNRDFTKTFDIGPRQLVKTYKS